MEQDRRHAPRTPAVGHAALTAVDCRHVASGSVINATVVDISTAAAGLSVQAPIEDGDRLRLTAQLFGVTLDVEVTVASARPAGAHGETAAGCTFAGSMTGEQRIALERVVLARVAQDD
ncbi:MAG: PilZ domain-containing protein, partial [Gaiellales bacterium]